MLFEFNETSFDIDERYVSEERVESFFVNILEIAKQEKIDIYEITVSEEDCTFIYINKKGKPDEWDPETINFIRSMENNNYDILPSDEDYGESLDVLILYDNING